MENLSIRPLAVDDAAAMVDVLGSRQLYVHTGGRPPTLAELTARYASQVTGRSPDGSQEWLNWIVTVDGAPVGYVQASRPVTGTTADIAWVVGAPWQGRGFATAAVRRMMRELRGRGIDEVTACISPANEASVRVAQRTGMVPTDRTVDGETVWLGRPAT